MANSIRERNPPELSEEIELTIQSPINVVLEGEGGVGKDYLAKLIHQRRNWGGELMVHDCERAVPDQTGIIRQFTSPRFLQRLQRPAEKEAHFIRRIDLLQAHLLAQLSDFFEELGKRGVFPRRQVLNLGLIGSLQTGRQKESVIDIQLHRFLNILFCLKIRIPPLRERTREIPKLADRFISLFNKEQKRRILGISPDALACLLQYDWPDNIGELRSEIERSATLTKDYQPIKPQALSENIIKSVSKTPSLS
jgi:hypothetical protein